MAMFLLGFRKIDGDRWEFANEDFLRGKRSLLKNINRRRSPRAQPKAPCLGSSMAIELLGAEDELQELKGQKHIMMQEVAKMKHEHLANIEKMDKLNCRLLSAESRQKQMMSFWLKVLRNPNFLMQLRQNKKLRQIASSSLEPEQQIVKNSQSFREPGSTFVLRGLESSSETQLNASSKGKNMPISSPEEFCSNKMAVKPLSKSSAPQFLQIETFNGESVGNFTSEYDLWDNIFCANSVAPGEEIGMWDSGLHSDEAFDLDKCFFSEFPLLPDMEEDGRRDDDPGSLET